jgi:hypothetical protein
MSDMTLREQGSATATCPTCGAALGVSTTAYGSEVADTCLVCYGDPASAPADPPAPEPVPTALDQLDPPTTPAVTEETN